MDIIEPLTITSNRQTERPAMDRTEMAYIISYDTVGDKERRGRLGSHDDPIITEHRTDRPIGAVAHRHTAIRPNSQSGHVRSDKHAHRADWRNHVLCFGAPVGRDGLPNRGCRPRATHQ